MVLLAREQKTGSPRGRVGKARGIRSPADYLGERSAHPDALMVYVAARALLLRLDEGQEAETHCCGLPADRVVVSNTGTGRNDRSPNPEARRVVCHTDPPTHQEGRCLL